MMSLQLCYQCFMRNGIPSNDPPDPVSGPATGSDGDNVVLSECENVCSVPLLVMCIIIII